MPGSLAPGPAAPGPGVDIAGRPVIDPTANVTAIVEAAVKRQDDLRLASERRADDMANLRAHYDELLRAKDAQLAQKESDRIDAIRLVDVGNVSRAAEEAATRANTLATQVATAADVVRTTLATALEPIMKDIADLRRAQYEAQGQKTQVVEGRSANGAVVAAVGLGITLVVALIGLIGFIAANSP